MGSFLFTLALLSLHCFVCALPQFLNLIPNGQASSRPGSGITCRHLGHQACTPPVNNQFGLDFNASGRTWTKEFCNKDSDSDGLTNGEELGDPCCEWTTENKTRLRTTNLSHPGEATETATGNVTCAALRASTTTGTTTTTTTGSGATNQTSTAPICFPADSIVRLQSGAAVPMADLAVGDIVEVAAGVYSPVFMFTHKMDDVHSEFVSVRTGRGANIRLSPGHFMYFNGKLAPAREVRVGDRVEVDGARDRVVAVSRVVKRGLYNPQTVRGDIVVDRVKVSTYTQAFHYGGAQAALTPFRALYGWFGLSVHALEKGVPGAFLPRAEL